MTRICAHMRCRDIVVLALSIFLVLQTSAFAEKRVALVIGNSKYSHVPSLPNPANDAASVAKLLRDANFEVVVGRNDLGVADLRRAIRDFADTSRDADIAVVYYAGHGIEYGGANYLVPVDAKLQADLDIEDEAVSLDRVLSALEPAKKLRLVILDACRENPFVSSIKRTVATRSISRGLAKVEPAMPDTLVAFAAKAGAVAEDGDGKNSPFTMAILKHLAEPGLDLRLAFGRVRDDVMAMTKRKQEPFVYGSLGGKVVAIIPRDMNVQKAPNPDVARRDMGIFAGKTVQIEIVDQSKRVTPRPGISTFRRTVSVYFKNPTELPTKIVSQSVKGGRPILGTFIGTLDAPNGQTMQWSINGNRLTGNFKSRITWEAVVQVDGPKCSAKIAYAPPAGRTNYLVKNTKTKEPAILSSISPISVRCSVLPGDKVGLR